MIAVPDRNKEDKGVLKPIEALTVTKLTVVPKPLVKPENPPTEVPKDQIGNCDNLTASYWG